MKSFFDKYGIYIPLICVIIFSVSSIVSGDTRHWSTVILSNALVYGLGFQLVIAGGLHIFKGDSLAEYIGWPKGSPFQYEVGVAGIAFGVLGLMCAWMPEEFWLAPIVAITIFGWGAGIGHIREMKKTKNKNPGNAGFFFYWDFLFPLFLIVLFCIGKKYA